MTIPVRAKVGYIEVQRDSKGRKVKARDEVVTAQGMLTAKEMETEMMRICDDKGYSYDQIRIETYQHGAAPIEANPRHRDAEAQRKMWFRGERRQVWGGWSPPGK